METEAKGRNGLEIGYYLYLKIRASGRLCTTLCKPDHRKLENQACWSDCMNLTTHQLLSAKVIACFCPRGDEVNFKFLGVRALCALTLEEMR